jgi:hypothetical protein
VDAGVETGWLAGVGGMGWAESVLVMRQNYSAAGVVRQSPESRLPRLTDVA